MRLSRVALRTIYNDRFKVGIVWAALSGDCALWGSCWCQIRKTETTPSFGVYLSPFDVKNERKFIR